MLNLAEYQRTVGSTETEVVVHRDIDLHVACYIRTVVQIAFRVLFENIDGWRRNLMMHRQRAKHRLYPARAAQQMTSHRLGGIHHQLPGMIAKRPVSYTHLRAHETVLDLVCRLL